ncbi:hypothetical protein CRG98_004394 [Punica granatum]|uniref:Uncharacterized protein n=1 Tax=Punica granatum TaxID=22663 RepID=A0A2I0L3N5_PUNGR|nr:hypothetical protein CRG98_004394 [Punica granatum]
MRKDENALTILQKFQSSAIAYPRRSVNESGVELGPERRARSLRKGKGAEREGNWRRQEKKRARNVRESIKVMVLEFRGFKGMVEGEKEKKETMEDGVGSSLIPLDCWFCFLVVWA